MEVPGLCAICGALAKPAYTCTSCGAIVCARCFNMDIGLCKRCENQMSRGV